jgi:hypothetical protein
MGVTWCRDRDGTGWISRGGGGGGLGLARSIPRARARASLFRVRFFQLSRFITAVPFVGVACLDRPTDLLIWSSSSTRIRVRLQFSREGKHSLDATESSNLLLVDTKIASMFVGETVTKKFRGGREALRAGAKW